MAKRETREEKQARIEREARERKASEFKARANRARALRVYSEKVAWDAMAATSSIENRLLSTLFDMVRRYQDVSTRLRRCMQSVAEEMADATRRLDDGRVDVFSGTYALGHQAAELEQLVAKRTSLAQATDSVAHAAGWWVPEVHDSRVNTRHQQLATMEVLPCGGGYGVRVLDGETAAWLSADGLQADGMVYETEEAAWLAAAEWFGGWL